jgi:hypothetical protein
VRQDPVEAHAYTPQAEPEVLAILHTAFGASWGDLAHWRWKHLQRPGFSVHDVRVYRSAGRAIGCWHMASRVVRLGAGLEIPASVEGDYAMHPDWRGVGMGRDPASLRQVRALAERGIVVRLGFTSPPLFERVYRPKLGYRRIPVTTAAYRKLLSDRALCERLQRAGEQLRSRPFIAKLLRAGPLTIALEVHGFGRCILVMEAATTRCTPAGEPQPTDLEIRLPLAILNTRTPAAAAQAGCGAALRGELRVRHALRFARRVTTAMLRARAAGNET